MHKEYAVFKCQIPMVILDILLLIPFILKENPCGSLPSYDPFCKEGSANKAFKNWFGHIDIWISKQVLVS